MSIEHRDITDSQRHEPKGASTAVLNSVWFANGAGSGGFTKIKESLIDYTDKASNRFGWNDIADSQYTVSSPRTISANTRTQLTNNGLGTQTDVTRLGSIWNTGTSQFLINDLNSTYVARISMKIKTAAAAGTPYTLKIETESGNGPTVISGNDQFFKGGNYENDVSFTQLFYVGSFVNNQSLKLFVTADANISLYNVGFVIQRLYKET